MSTPFNATEGLVLVHARITRPKDQVRVRLALDIGSTETLVNHDLLVLAGYDPDTGRRRVSITTASGEVSAPIIRVRELEALGRSRPDMDIVCHTLPEGADVDGLLGLDFFRGHRLTLDFRIGQIELE